MPPFTILKVSKTSSKDVQVLGEFETEEEARAHAELCRANDRSNAYEYRVERPPEAHDLKRMDLFTPPL